MDDGILKRHIRTAIVTIGCLLFSACRPVGTIQEVPGQEITILFDGFAYLGERSAQPREKVWKRSGDYPSVLQPNTEYFFRHRLPVDTVFLAMSVFPARLKKLGYSIVEAPKNDGSGLVVLDNGGPLYTVKARRGACEIAITRVADREVPATSSGWGSEKWEDGGYFLDVGSGCVVAARP